MPVEISIVIPVFNREKMLSLCLNSLMELEYPKEKLEIIVVDNNSTDGSREVIKRFPVKCVIETKRNRSAARNKGIQESRGEFVAFIDSDCTADKYWLKNLMKGFTKESIGGCGGTLLSYQVKTYIERFKEIQSAPFREGRVLSKDLFLAALPTPNVVYRRKTLMEAGLFDDYFDFSSEDIDLSWRVCLRNYQLRYIPDAIVYYKYRDTIRGLFSQAFQAGYSNIYLYKKYKNISQRLHRPHFIRLVRFPLLCCQNLVSFFIKSLTREDRFKIFFPLLEIIDELAILLGEIYGVSILNYYFYKDKIPSLQPPENKIVWRKSCNEIIITHLDKEFDYSLNNIGAQIWELLMDGYNNSEIINTIVNKYEISREQAEKDLVCLTDELKREGLLQIQSK